MTRPTPKSIRTATLVPSTSLSRPLRDGREGAPGRHAVEDLADHVEGRGQVRAPDPEEDTDRRAPVRAGRTLTGQRTGGTFQHDVGRAFVPHLLHVEGL